MHGQLSMHNAQVYIYSLCKFFCNLGVRLERSPPGVLQQCEAQFLSLHKKALLMVCNDEVRVQLPCYPYGKPLLLGRELSEEDWISHKL